MKMKSKVSLSFGKIPDGDLTIVAKTVLENMYARAVYDSPPVPESVLRAAIAAFQEAKVEQADGGRRATAAKNQRRAELLDLLRKLAYYVQIACDGELATLLSSGFQAKSENRSQTPLEKAVLRRVVHGRSGQSLVTTKAQPNVRNWEVIVAELDEDGKPGPYRKATLSTSSRNIPVDGLTPGKLHSYQARALGGSTGCSDWSDALIQRAL